MVADVVAQKYGVSKQDVLAGDGEQSAGLNVINHLFFFGTDGETKLTRIFFPLTKCYLPENTWLLSRNILGLFLGVCCQAMRYLASEACD